ncbi:MAG: hypothetical protein IPL61_37680 [Myxococcales bacterium]|nr:hypothetical protein [Myxococcales bacterium]
MRMRAITIFLALAATAGAAAGERAPMPTHVTPWAPTGEVVEPGRVRLEYTVVAHVGAAVGLADGLELRLSAGAPQPPVQLFEADLALRGQLVRAGPVRVAVGAIGAAAWLGDSHDASRSSGRWLHGGEATVGLLDPRGHVAWSHRRLRDPDGTTAVDVDVVTASWVIAHVRVVGAVGRVRDARAGRCGVTAARATAPALPCAPGEHADVAALGVSFRGGRITGTAGLAAALFDDYPPVPLPYLTISVPLEL